ncbi:transcriptional regulator [Candidatus Williamhamiltonella defendens]|nr:helix-turn-helix domain-containing protein [Candidatus Hamiltonella defensa]AYB49566.1 transcriptional regulator [Candidatus Hamiltonella defensa]
MNKVIKKAVKILGSQTKLANACGVTQSAVQKWLHCKTKVAPTNVGSLIKATNGAFQAYEIRPDLPDLFPL